MKSLFALSVCVLALGGAVFRLAHGRGESTRQAAPEVEMPGRQMKAFLVVFEAFRKIPDLPQEKKRLDNYTVSFSETASQIEVYFVPRAETKPGYVIQGGENRYG